MKNFINYSNFIYSQHEKYLNSNPLQVMSSSINLKLI